MLVGRGARIKNKLFWGVMVQKRLRTTGLGYEMTIIAICSTRHVPIFNFSYNFEPRCLMSLIVQLSIAIINLLRSFLCKDNRFWEIFFLKRYKNSILGINRKYYIYKDKNIKL